MSDAVFVDFNPAILRGNDGVSVIGASVNTNGQLELLLTSGVTVVTGNVVGSPATPADWTDGLAGGVSRSLIEKVSRTLLDVGDFGAVGDGTTDDTAAFQAAIDAVSANGGHVLVPAAATGTTYRIDGTIVIKRRVHLDLAGGATLKRITALSASTDPIVRIGGNDARLTGGRLETENGSPNGVLLLGGPDLSTAAAVEFCHVSNVHIAGVKATGNVGVRLWSAFVIAGSSAVTYQNMFHGVTVDGFGTGVYVSDVANANEFHAMQLLNINDWAFDFYGNTPANRGADENAVIGGFFSSSSGAGAFRLRNVVYNRVDGFRMEQGGAGVPYSLDVNCQFNHLSLSSNTSGIGADAGTSNTVSSNGVATGQVAIRAGAGSASTPAFAFAADTATGFFRQSAQVLSASTGGTERWRLGTNLSMLTNLQINANYLEFLERTTPSTPGANVVRLFARDDGAGNTQLCFVDSTGTVKAISAT